MKTYNIALSLSLIAALTNVFGDDIEDVDLGESVVTATGYQQLLKEAPASISIITKDELLNRPIRDLGDALQEVPGISTSISKTGSNSIMMRGLDSKYTLILIDGKRQNVAKGFGGNGFDPTSGFIPPTSMIERIEVIRGPASVIYGSDALGGVINIITKKTPNKLTGSFQLETRLQENNRNWGHMYGFNGYIATPLIDDVLSMNLRGRFNTTGPNKFYKSDIPGYTGNATTNPYTSHSPTGYTIASVGGRLNYTINDENNIYIDSEFNYQNLGSLNTSSSQITAIRDYYKYNTVINHDASYEFGDFTSQQLMQILDDSGVYQTIMRAIYQCLDQSHKNKDDIQKIIYTGSASIVYGIQEKINSHFHLHQKISLNIDEMICLGALSYPVRYQIEDHLKQIGTMVKRQYGHGQFSLVFRTMLPSYSQMKMTSIPAKIPRQGILYIFEGYLGAGIHDCTLLKRVDLTAYTQGIYQDVLEKLSNGGKLSVLIYDQNNEVINRIPV